MFTVHSLAVHIEKLNLDLIKIKIQGQEEVGTGPSSEEINHFYSACIMAPFPLKSEVSLWKC